MSRVNGQVYWLQEPHARSRPQVQWSLSVSGFGDVLHSLIQTRLQTLCCTTTDSCIAGYPSPLTDREIGAFYRELLIDPRELDFPISVNRFLPSLEKTIDWNKSCGFVFPEKFCKQTEVRKGTDWFKWQEGTGEEVDHLGTKVMTFIILIKSVDMY